MKRDLKKLICVILAVGMLGILTACGSKDLDATLYIQGIMDKTYLGVYNKDYLEMVESTEKEAAEEYIEGLEYEYTAYFVSNFEIDDDYISDGLREEFIDLLADVYSHAKYEVKDAGKQDDSYRVEVIISPVDVFYQVYEEDMDGFATEFNASYADYTSEKLDTMSESEREAFWHTYEEDWAQGILDLCRARLETVGYRTEESIIVQVKPDPADGYYTISDTDFATIDKLILAY